MLRNLLILTGVLTLVALTRAPASAGVLDAVKQRDVLNCGTDNTTPGFGYLNTRTGKMEGIDVDFCKATAAAVLGDASKVKFVVVNDKSRFNALQTNQVDVVYAHTTVKPARESAVGIDFLPINFYDGTGVMVKATTGVKAFSELSGATICTTQGSGTEATLSASIQLRGWKTTKVLTYENGEKLFAALDSGRCTAMSTDKSALASWRGNAARPDDFVILPDILDKSPFAGFVVQNDSKWRDALRWVNYALFQAEEIGITSSNVNEKLMSKDPFVMKFLGVGGGFGKDFGIPDGFVAATIKAVGNYGEIYDRNVGPKTAYFIDRKGTQNAMWSQGGLIYSPVWQ